MRKVASADNRSISIVHARNSSRDSQAKLIVRPVVKWRECRGKNCDKSDLLRKTHVRLTQCSKPVKNRKKTVFLFIRPDFLTDLNGRRQRLLFAPQLIHRKCIASARRVTKHGNHSGDKAFKHSLVDVDGVGLDEMTTGKVKRKYIKKKNNLIFKKLVFYLINFEIWASIISQERK